MPSTVAIAGSVDPNRAQELGLTDLNTARAACEALGRALAQAGCRIVVYSSEPDFVEADVVRGYVGSGQAREGSIEIRYPDGGDWRFPEMQDHRPVFIERPDVSDSWEVSFYRSLFEADGLLLIGGGQSTLVAGLIAISAKRPIVAVAAFGGKAREVREALAHAHNDADEQELELMGRGWVSGAETGLVSALDAQRRRRDAREAAARRATRGAARRRRNSFGASILAAIAAIAAILIVQKTKPGSIPSLIALFAAPLLAGVAGGIFRTAFDHKPDWSNAALLGFGAGFASAVLFIAAQLITLSTILKDESVRTLVVLVTGIGLIAGVTFDLVFKKLLRQDVVDTSPLDLS